MDPALSAPSFTSPPFAYFAADCVSALLRALILHRCWVLASASASASPDLRSSVITEARSEIHLSFPFTAATPSICLPGALNVAAVSEELAARQQDGDAGKPTGGDSPLEMEEKNGRRYLAMQRCRFRLFLPPATDELECETVSETRVESA
ncbi:uncharacterized protein [Arachis hypogaea]|uniref:uncharacterized protein isoform X1 n=1 Tax=Arachis hypogaea TaxID=3818 RepID=UPI003B2255A2